MSEYQSDGIGEAIEDLIRSGMLLGTRLAERRTRTREERFRAAARESLGHARSEREHQRAERAAGVSELDGVFSEAWWNHASAEDIRRAWTTARTYQAEDPRAATAVWRMADEVRDRYSLDVFEVDPEAFGQRDELEALTPVTDEELDRYDRELARLRGSLDRDPRTGEPGVGEEVSRRRAEIDELRGLIREERGQPPPGERREREAREVSDVALVSGAGVDAYDTRERRTLLAERLTALGVDEDAVQAAVLADVSNAYPPEMATVASSEAPRARVSTQARRVPRQARRPR